MTMKSTYMPSGFIPVANWFVLYLYVHCAGRDEDCHLICCLLLACSVWEWTSCGLLDSRSKGWFIGGSDGIMTENGKFPYYYLSESASCRRWSQVALLPWNGTYPKHPRQIEFVSAEADLKWRSVTLCHLCYCHFVPFVLCRYLQQKWY